MLVISESLTKAADSAAFVRNDLREALSGASATESLILLPLIERAATLKRDIEALQAARDSDAVIA